VLDVAVIADDLLESLPWRLTIPIHPVRRWKWWTPQRIWGRWLSTPAERYQVCAL